MKVYGSIYVTIDGVLRKLKWFAEYLDFNMRVSILHLQHNSIMCTTLIEDRIIKYNVHIHVCIVVVFSSDATGSFTGGENEAQTMFLLDDVMCVGNETSLLDCEHAGIHFHNCFPREKAGVHCGMCVYIYVCVYVAARHFCTLMSYISC